MNPTTLNLYIQCLDIADDYMQLDPEAGNVSSSLKQAATDLGIEWGQPMADFIAWAYEQMANN
jgi:hypothetical protein